MQLQQSSPRAGLGGLLLGMNAPGSGTPFCCRIHTTQQLLQQCDNIGVESSRSGLASESIGWHGIASVSMEGSMEQGSMKCFKKAQCAAEISADRIKLACGIISLSVECQVFPSAAATPRHRFHASEMVTRKLSQSKAERGSGST